MNLNINPYEKARDTGNDNLCFVPISSSSSNFTAIFNYSNLSPALLSLVDNFFKFLNNIIVIKYFPALFTNIRRYILYDNNRAAWFYSPEWQAMEKKVDEQKREGKARSADNAEELFRDLGLNDL